MGPLAGTTGGRMSTLRQGVRAPFVALGRSIGDPRVVRIQLAWAAVMIGSWAATVSLSVAAFSAGGSRAVAVAVLARTIPGALAGPAVGVLVDRVPHRWSLVGAAAVSFAAAGGAAAVRPLAALIALITVVALATMVFRTAQSAVVPALVSDPADLTAANVLSSAVESLGVFVGPALAGLLLSLAGPGLAFGAAAALFSAAAATLLGLRVPPSGPPPGEDTLRGSFRDLTRLAPARLMLLLVLAQTVVAGGLVVLYPALAVGTLGADVSLAGGLASAFGLGGVVTSLLLFGLAGSRRLGLYSFGALLLWAGPLALVPALPSLSPVLGLLALVGAGNVLFDVTIVTLLQRGVPAHLLGRAFGALETAVVLGLGLGSVAATLLDTALDPARALAVLAGPLALVALVALPGLRTLDRTLAAPTRQVALLRGLETFALLAPQQVELLALHLAPRELATGEVVFAQGALGTTWFLVEDGTLTVTVDGREVRTLGSGDTFGEVALLRTGVRTATITATGPVTVWSMEGETFLAALRADDGRALAALDALAQERLAHATPAD